MIYTLIFKFWPAPLHTISLASSHREPLACMTGCWKATESSIGDPESPDKVVNEYPLSDTNVVYCLNT